MDLPKRDDPDVEEKLRQYNQETADLMSAHNLLAQHRGTPTIPPPVTFLGVVMFVVFLLGSALGFAIGRFS